MAISKTFGRSVVALAIAIAPVASVTVGASGMAFAKSGSGGGNSGGSGKSGNGGGHRNAHSATGMQDKARASKSDRGAGDILKSLFTRGTKANKTIKAGKVAKTANVAATRPKSLNADYAGLNSLNRNYHAYINSNDRRMAAISAYAMAYAQFEAANGPGAIPTDPALSDEALRGALTSFTKEGVVTDDALAEAKEILGVGSAAGKIDQIRETLPKTSSETTDSELEIAN
ncbi:hypothetical protein PYH37_000614 [Sinorhizobium numidicum]|uniref:Uncharacterized protein n=1 Tax=Sinorhizobium numidicum TaxID=680248 RepID=A0ABY8CUU7_9HYPH|nr:hypothetical protein [Sinorhizobium numidicum]WEX75232.1 hypothetical protein PYH37_000614 [Sinorhizobium numidicum]WEX81227.1 hypothetical protein PYH38_000616 [Sinorhizobium numidicum]